MHTFSKREIRKLVSDLTIGHQVVRERALSYLRSLGSDAVLVLHEAIDRHGQNWAARAVATPIAVVALAFLVLLAFIGNLD